MKVSAGRTDVLDVLIVGGGLAGLALAERLEEAGVDYRLLEARDRLGGRILTATVQGGDFDLGPSWFWPAQPRMAAMVDRLGLQAFEQYATGDSAFEDQDGSVHRGVGFVSMAGAYRLAGGLGALVSALAARLTPERVRTGAAVTALSQEADAVLATIDDAAGSSIRAQRVVLALPPRVAAATINFTPALSDPARRAMASIPTWMAGQAKILAVFDRPYWREDGLSGDAASRKGPMVEIHDTSAESGPYALFGFLGLPPDVRAEKPDEVLGKARAQLERLFGPALRDPVSLTMQDWAQEPLTATQADHQPLVQHPAYGMPRELIDLWGGRLCFGSTEVADGFGGMLEGALEAAERSFRALDRQ